MKKLLLTILAGVVLFNANAQDLKKATLYSPPFDAEYVEGIFGEINGVSSNGEYAVGFDGMVNSGAFVWKRSTGKFEIVEMAGMLMDAANDGTLVGNYWVEIPGGNGSIATRPGYYKDGVWSPLPLHRLEAELAEDTEQNLSSDLNGCATAISADCKFIGGYITDANVYKLFPVLWQWDEESQEYIIADAFEEIQENIDRLDCPYGWNVKGISDDGKVLAGWSEWGSGARSAAVIIDGKEKRITGLEDPFVLAEQYPDKSFGVFDSYAVVSANGQYFTGVYSDDGSAVAMQSFTWNQTQESVSFLELGPVFSAVDNNGVCYGANQYLGHPVKYANGKMELLSDYYTWEEPKDVYMSTVFATSDDGGVLGGFCVATFSIGQITVPGVLVLDGTDGVEAVKGDVTSVRMFAGYAFIDGAYENAVVYNMQGAVVAQATEGNIDLNNVPAGVYVVNVDGQSFKVVK